MLSKTDRMRAMRAEYHRQFKRRKDRKAAKAKANTEPGKWPRHPKGESCSASRLERGICARNRSYKWAEYTAWSEKYGSNRAITR